MTKQKYLVVNIIKYIVYDFNIVNKIILKD